MKDVLLFSGTSNLLLAQKVAADLHIRLSDIHVTRFLDNECHVYIPKTPDPDAHIFVIQSLSEIADQRLVELCLIGQALKSLNVRHVTAVIPWLGYSKQDKEFRKGEAVSSQLVAKFIEAAGFDEIITVELHSENLIPYFSIPVTECSTHGLFSQKVTDRIQTVVISPDKGGQSRSERFAKNVGLPIVRLTKKRDLDSGDVTIVGMHGDVAGKTCIMFDDIINTGATAMKAAQFLKNHKAKTVTVMATHAVLAGDTSRKLEHSGIDQIITTDTIDIPTTKHMQNMQILSVSGLLAEAVTKSMQ